MSENLNRLKSIMADVSRLSQAASLLGWDQQTYMPPGAGNARAEQLATLTALTHKMFVAEETGNLLAACEAESAGRDADDDDVRMLAVLRRDYDQETRLPTDLVTALARHTALAQEIWVRAREKNDFASFIPALETMIELTRRQAECLGYKDHIYDALIDRYEPGLTQAQVASMFAEMKPDLVSLTSSIARSPRKVDVGPVHGEFPVEVQKRVTLKLVQQMGFDLTRGRQDEAAHPFCSNFSRDDVRITTRYNAGYLSQALYASLHEAGHGMYEQGSPPEFEATCLAGGASLGVHESQSRLWENIVGRSRAFTTWSLPQLREAFPTALSDVSEEAYYRAINRVEPSLIRVEADEATYNLHILLRFEIECELLTGTLAVADLPKTWNERMEQYLGIVPPDDTSGVLQDIHWSGGLIGYFPTYTVGNLISAQLWNTIQTAIPDVDSGISKGYFTPILNWLRENIHRHGRKYLPGELMERATGEPLTSKYYVRYMRNKFGDIYGL